LLPLLQITFIGVAEKGLVSVGAQHHLLEEEHYHLLEEHLMDQYCYLE
jgi:hypothetical protein